MINCNIIKLFIFFYDDIQIKKKTTFIYNYAVLDTKKIEAEGVHHFLLPQILMKLQWLQIHIGSDYYCQSFLNSNEKL